MADRGNTTRPPKVRRHRRRRDRPGGFDPKRVIILALLVLAWLGLTIGLFRTSVSEDHERVAYSVFKEQLRAGEIGRVLIEGVEITAQLRVADPDAVEDAPAEIHTVAPEMGDPTLLALLEEQGVEIQNTPATDGSALLGWLPLLLIVAFWFLLASRASGRAGLPGMGDVMGQASRRIEPEDVGVTFEDVAGQDEAKREVAELVDFLADPARFVRLGARPPRGVLLMGPPGTGKTLLAKALAGEAGVPFFSTSGSAFIEVFVGVGAGRVRRLFEAARKSAPAIVFIDELDSIGRTRGAGLGGGHDEREQTLNQILAELDGFDERSAVVVLAATNRPDILDPALLRPGRFDRHVTLSLPGVAERRAILDVHVRGVPLEKALDLDAVAAGTPGFSGADLRNLVNEAAIAAARRGAEAVSSADMDEARDRMMMGTLRTLAITPAERHRIAVHEAGHAAVAFFLPDADPLFKVTIIPRGHSLGGTHLLPSEERHTLPEPYLRAQLAITLAGQAAERLLLGTVSSGADDDIAKATSLARSMVSRWGMDEEIGPVDLRSSSDHPFLGREIAQPRGFADQTAARVDAAVTETLREAQATATGLLERNRRALERLVTRLEAAETLSAEEIAHCLSGGAGDVLPIDGSRSRR